MKEKFITLQAKLMDLILLSGLILIGAMTIVGFFYGIVAAFVYLQNKSENKWLVLKKRQTIIISLLLEISAVFVSSIFFLNATLIPKLHGGTTVIISFFLAVCFLILIPLYLILLWELAIGTIFTKEIFLISIKVILICFPTWLTQIVLMIGVSIITYLFPALSIITVGFLAMRTGRVIDEQKTTLAVLQEDC
ncbi:hypothetical protein JZO76_02555 [Enterococcus sp. MJM12]|uniref:DUF624 domain-containing protein n=1 Tax=Candidatus Enterococcus myersii TaxID=2815322 RepID=A0ABS3H4L6_9ENTE|nr:hypothetical protein [Enterococcus sp. MJM12]MBO0448407.1 hypothetical protein [Enterococcus sp. MJM12]